MSNIRIEDDGPIRTITLNRPERRNALNPQMMNELTIALNEVNSSGMRIVVLTGEGESFCSGLDLAVLEEMADFTPERHRVEAERVARMFHALWECGVPTISVVRGAAVAGGAGLAALCDFTLAAPEAKFGYTEVRIGFVPALVSAYLLLQLGDKRARNLLLSGRLISAEEAERLGLVSEVVAAENLNDRAAELARELLRNSPESLHTTKHLLREQHARFLDHALEQALDANAISRESTDFREGLASFLQKRPPSWQRTN